MGRINVPLPIFAGASVPNICAWLGGQFVPRALVAEAKMCFLGSLGRGGDVCLAGQESRSSLSSVALRSPSRPRRLEGAKIALDAVDQVRGALVGSS